MLVGFHPTGRLQGWMEGCQGRTLTLTGQILPLRGYPFTFVQVNDFEYTPLFLCLNWVFQACSVHVLDWYYLGIANCFGLLSYRILGGNSWNAHISCGNTEECSDCDVPRAYFSLVVGYHPWLLLMFLLIGWKNLSQAIFLTISWYICYSFEASCNAIKRH